MNQFSEKVSNNKLTKFSKQYEISKKIIWIIIKYHK